MQLSTTKSVLAVFLGLASLAAGCAGAPGKTELSKSDSDGMPALTTLYQRAMPHREQSQRAPVVQERERAMKLLAVKTEEVLAQASRWDTDARLVGLNPSQKSEVHSSVSDFRESLHGLKTAAASGSPAAVEANYLRVMQRYQRVLQTTGTEK